MAAQKKYTKTFVVGPFRMAFPALFTPERQDDGSERYKLTALFPPDSKSIKQIEDALYDAMEDGFGKESEWPTGRNDSNPEQKFYDAGTKSKYTGFIKGWRALSVSSKDQPGLVDAEGEEVINPRDVYGGRWARAQITVTWYDNKSKGVTAYLNHVQLLEHDDPFSGKGNAKDVFKDEGGSDARNDRGRDDAARGSNSRDDRGSRNATREDNGRGEDRGSSRNRDREETPRRSREEERDDRRTEDARNVRGQSREASRSRRDEMDDGEERNQSNRASGSRRSSDDEWN